MRAIIIRFALAFALIIAVFAVATALQDRNRVGEISGQLLVTINEMRNGDASVQADADERARELIAQLEPTASGQNTLLVALALSLGVCALFFFYVYRAILRPFHKLERFAQNVAAGDFDKPLDMPRHNVFGAFSWAFDSMREHLHDARQAEAAARHENRLLIATISHDIKTPVASIRACAEGLTSGQASTDERRERYLTTIIRKSDEVARLTDDLFLHALSDMDKLVIEPRPLPLRAFIAEISQSLEVEISAEVPDVSIRADERRLAELFGNIVHNAEKYAPVSPCTLSFLQADELLYCVFADRGQSLADTDVPFIFDKFYRGRNVGEQQGSGLGLYIVRYLAEQMGGRAYAERDEDGLRIFVGLVLDS